MEWLLSRLSFQVAAALGSKAKFDEFLRYHDAPKQEVASDEIDVMSLAKVFGATIVERGSNG